MTPREELIEGMARAIYEEHWRTRNSRDSRCLWENHALIGKSPWLLEASAALEALKDMGCAVVPREPTEAMRNAARMSLSGNNPWGNIIMDVIAASPYAKEKA